MKCCRCQKNAWIAGNRFALQPHGKRKTAANWITGLNADLSFDYALA
jgi:hypothetical protein